MGCGISKRIEQSSHHSSSTPPSSRTTSSSVTSQDADLSAYEAACRADPDLRNFDSSLQARTSRAIISVASSVDVQSVSLDSLRDVTECLLEMNEGVVKVILQNKKDIWKNRELSDLVDDYFENSLQTLGFCTVLESCLKRASHIQSIINVAIRKFEEEHFGDSENGSVKTYSRTLDELRSFRGADEPFTEEFFNMFQSVYTQQLIMLEKLQAKKHKLDKKLGKLKAWRKVSNVIFVVAFASVLICSVVAAAVSAPPVLTALAAAAAVPLGSMGKWLNSLWKKYENELMLQRETVFSMQIGNLIMIKDLGNIRASVDQFQVKIEELLSNAEFAMRGEEAVVIAVEEIKKNVNGFMKTIEDLNEHADRCSRETRMARALILRRIMDGSSRNPSLGVRGNSAAWIYVCQLMIVCLKLCGGKVQTQLATYDDYIEIHVWVTLCPTKKEHQKQYWTSMKPLFDVGDDVVNEAW